MTYRNDILEYVNNKYGSEPEHLWARFPDYVIFRHGDNQKWYGLIMNIPKEKLGLSGTEIVDILNVKLDDPILVDILTQQDGFFPGYHIRKGNWISILLDGTVPVEEIFGFIDTSFIVTASRQKKQKHRPPKEWLIPANPKYYDVVQAFKESSIIDWKQGNGIKVGDTVYMYLAAPISAILYKCIVLETGIPYNRLNENINIKALMKIQLLKEYDPSEFTFERLKEDYDIFAVRGPRGIPHVLSAALNYR